MAYSRTTPGTPRLRTPQFAYDNVGVFQSLRNRDTRDSRPDYCGRNMLFVVLSDFEVSCFLLRQGSGMHGDIFGI